MREYILYVIKSDKIKIPTQGAGIYIWCLGSDSNRHGYSPADFESAASTNFATQAIFVNRIIRIFSL